ncbi:MAG: competence/damage-inducible protein A [Armatimonadetes bacterium]|nr:competence/damage-inducible protein A [Armatimonadota bacterium]
MESSVNPPEAANHPLIEIFAIGTELVIGRIQDTNSTWLAEQITELGGRIRRVTLLTDEKEEIIRALQDSVDRGTRILIATGGLGPTPDDLTVDAVAEWIGVPVVTSDVAVEDYCRRRSLTREELSENLLRMARCPEGAEVMTNPVGWAPCIRVEAKGVRLFIMPGPPKEVQGLFPRYIAPYISESYEIRSASMRVEVDLWESEASPLMEATMERHPGVYLKAYVALRNSPEERLPVDLVATGEDAASAHAILHAALDDFAAQVRQKGRSIDYAAEES